MEPIEELMAAIPGTGDITPAQAFTAAIAVFEAAGLAQVSEYRRTERMLHMTLHHPTEPIGVSVVMSDHGNTDATAKMAALDAILQSAREARR